MTAGRAGGCDCAHSPRKRGPRPGAARAVGPSPPNSTTGSVASQARLRSGIRLDNVCEAVILLPEMPEMKVPGADDFNAPHGRVLVTGCAGFIGSRLVERLL